MGKSLKSFGQWRLEENLSNYGFYKRQLKRLVISMFKWSNLPDGISERFIEECLYYDGYIIFFKATQGPLKGSYVVSKASPYSKNIYNEPTHYKAYSSNMMINEIVEADNCVLIRNDYLLEGSIQKVNHYAKRISELDKTFDINMQHIKHPYIITGNENQISSIKSFYAKFNNGEPYIIVDQKFRDNNDIKVLPTTAENHLQLIQLLRRDIFNEALTSFGINNVNVNKKERLITAEADQNNEEIEMNRNALYLPRLKAVEEINQKFNLDVTIEINQNYREGVIE